MAISHRTNRLKLISQPSVTQLQNGRYRLVFTSSPLNPRNDWYNDNKSRIFADFGTLESAAMSVDGIDPRSGEAYTDMRLTDVQTQGQGDDYVVQFTYETLGDSFVQVKDDTIDYELNGLRRVQRESIAKAGVDFQKTVGTSTISSQIDDETAVTCYLASYQVDDTDSYRKVTETYIEAGIINVSTNNNSVTKEVIVSVIGSAIDAASVRASVPEVTANHSLKEQSTSNYEGFESINYVFEIRSTTTVTEVGDSQIGVNVDTGIQTSGSTDFIITRQYAVSSTNASSSIQELIPPAILDPVFDGTGGTEKAYIVDQDLKPNGQDGAVLTRTFAMVPSTLEEWDEMVIQFPGVESGPFNLPGDFDFRSSAFSEAVPIRICRDFYLSNPERIPLPCKFRPVDSEGNQTNVLNDSTNPTADEYIGYVNSKTYLVDRVSIHRWQGDIWERRVVSFRAE